MDYEVSWSILNDKLRATASTAGGLGAALSEVETHQRQIGFIQDDLQEVKRLIFGHPTPKRSKLSCAGKSKTFAPT